MGYRITPTKTFDFSLRKLDPHIARRVLEKIKELESDIIRISRLGFSPKGLEGLSKCKVGDWRILLWLDEGKKEITLYRVGHRKEIYRGL